MNYIYKYFLRVTSLALEQVYDCPNISEVTMNDIGKMFWC